MKQLILSGMFVVCGLSVSLASEKWAVDSINWHRAEQKMQEKDFQDAALTYKELITKGDSLFVDYAGRHVEDMREQYSIRHARPAASRNHPFTVDPQGRDSSLPCRVPLPPKQKPRKAPRPARSFCILKNVTPFSRRSAFSARPESRPAAPPAWGRRGQQAPPRRAPHACPSPSACS